MDTSIRKDQYGETSTDLNKNVVLYYDPSTDTYLIEYSSCSETVHYTYISSKILDILHNRAWENNKGETK